MSSSSSIPSTSTSSSVASSSSNPNPNPGNTTSSSLYLFTFLATLLLLLAVSCAIVARSLVVRRRFRRRVEEAIAAGLIPPQQVSLGAAFGVGPRRKDFGQKPTMWDSWLAPGEAKWSEIKPVSVKVISETLDGAGLPKDSPKANARTSTKPNDSNALQPRRRLLSAIPFPLTYQRFPTGMPPMSPATAAEEDKADGSPAELQVAVLIAMPSPYRPQSWSTNHQAGISCASKGKERSDSIYVDGEEDLPDVVFGVTELPWNPSTSGIEDSGSMKSEHNV